MAKNNRHASIDELEKLTSDLLEQVKVLVSAVDDLRCEVEWWAQNAAEERWQRETTARRDKRQSLPGGPDELESESQVVEPSPAPSPVASALAEAPASRDSIESASERLAKLERELMIGPPGSWPEGWQDLEPPELPTGKIVRVDEDLWNSVLELRPAHEVQAECYWCEEGMGGPLLLAWRNEDGCFLRELTEEEAIELQKACLAWQKAAELPIEPERGATQRGLFADS